MAQPMETSPEFPTIDTFAIRLREFRKMLKLTQEEAAALADAAGPASITDKAWATWENGTSPQRMNAKVTQIAAGLGNHFGYSETGIEAISDWLMWGLRSRCFCGRPDGHCECLVPAPDGQRQLFDPDNPAATTNPPPLASVTV